MWSGRVFIFALATVVVTGTNPCNLDPITWFETCPTNPLIVATFSGVTVESCSQTHTKELFTSLTSLKYTGSLDQNKTYTTAMVDPDAPGHAGGEAWLHWIRTGLKSKDLVVGIMTNGQDVVEYRPPTPPKNTGVHRYYIFVFEETDPVQPEEITRRAKFNLQAYATRQKLCGPIAATMFKTQY